MLPATTGALDSASFSFPLKDVSIPDINSNVCY